MPIKVVCPEGHKLNAKESLAGKKVRCPKCKSVVQIPQLETTETEAAPTATSPAAPAAQPSEDPLDTGSLGSTDQPSSDDPLFSNTEAASDDPLASSDPLAEAGSDASGSLEADPLGGGLGDPLAGNDALGDDPLSGDLFGGDAGEVPASLPSAPSPYAPTAKKAEPEPEPKPAKQTSPLMWALVGGGVVVLVLLLGGVAGWMLFGGDGEEQTAVADRGATADEQPPSAPAPSTDNDIAPAEPEPEPVRPLRYDGLYVARGHFLRFYEDGTVLEVGMSGGTNEKNAIQLAEWFNKEHTKPLPRGTFQQQGAQLTLQTSVPPDGKAEAEYEGEVTEDGILALKSSREREGREYRFLAVELDRGGLVIDNLADTKDKLKQIGIAFHNFHDTHKAFALPRAGAEGADERYATGLSWRVHLLPFLGQQPLYDRFKLEEPWDSPHNKALLEHMPDVYRVGSSSEPVTRIQVFTGEGMLFGNAKPGRLSDVTDGFGNTIMALVVGPEIAVPWTKPDELMLDADKPVASIGSKPEGYITCVLTDGQTMTFLNAIDPVDFRGFATPKGNEVVHPHRNNLMFEEFLKFQVGVDPNALPVAQPTAASSATASGPVLTDLDLHGKLQAIGMALQMHHDHFRMFTHPVSDSEHGSGLSWRVHILPFLGEQTLYQKFNLREPWDSPHNKPLLEQIPAVYRSDDPVRTPFVTFTGPEMLFGKDKEPSFQQFKDGIPNTVLVLTTGPSAAVPWTKPGDLPFEPSSIAKMVESLSGGTIECITADASLLTLPSDVGEETLKALLTPAGGEVLDVAALRKAHGPTDAKLPPEVVNLVETITKTKQGRITKLAQIGRAMHGYHDVYRQFPLARDDKFFDEQGKPLLSWRVHLLPFLDQGPLYKQFKLDEPWDSPHNKALLVELPEVFRDPEEPAGSTNTRFVVPTGKGAMFVGPDGPRIASVRDGTSGTILALVGGSDKAVPWTKPEELAFDESAPVACLGDLGASLIFVFADGSVNTVKSYIPPEFVKELMSPNGGKPAPAGGKNYGLRQ